MGLFIILFICVFIYLYILIYFIVIVCDFHLCGEPLIFVLYLRVRDLSFARLFLSKPRSRLSFACLFGLSEFEVCEFNLMGLFESCELGLSSSSSTWLSI